MPQGDPSRAGEVVLACGPLVAEAVAVPEVEVPRGVGEPDLERDHALKALDLLAIEGLASLLPEFELGAPKRLSIQLRKSAHAGMML